MALGMNPLGEGDLPEDYIENDDGSVEIPDTPAVEMDAEDFYQNLADVLPPEELRAAADDLIELIERDREARKKRDEQYEEGIRRTGLGDDAPGGAEFDGASRVVHPVMAEASVDFASSAIKELFPPSGPVRTDFVGELDRAVIERGERKCEFMNWQLTHQMSEYYDEMEQMLSQLPLGGSQYIKVRFDPTLRRPVAEFVPIDEIFVPYAASNFYTASRVTHRQLVTRQQFEERVESGLYVDVSPFAPSDSPEQSSAAIATDRVEGVEETAYNEDGLRAVLEVYTWRTFSDELAAGGAAPYVIHIDEHTEQVLGVFRNWDDQDPNFEKLDWIVEFKFIPWRGAYAIGLPHLIGGLSAALTGSLRALMDSAHINNAASMLKLKSGRVVGQNTQVAITQVTDIEAPANVDDIRKIAMPMPFNPPSPVLFQLLGFLTESAKGVVSTAEEKIAEAGNQMPVGTAMALIEQGSKVFSAIHARLHRSQTRVLKILHRINAKFLDEETQQEGLGKVLVLPEDFAGSLDVVPASDPNIFSESQRFAQIQAVLQMSQDARVQWDVHAIYRRMLQLMHVQQADEILPDLPDPLTSDPVSENHAAIQGKPIKPEIEQDHMAHIMAHLNYVSAPWVLQNPLVPPPVIESILNHIGVHLAHLHSVAYATAAADMGISDDAAAPQLITEVNMMLGEQVGQVMQQIQQVQQALASRAPQPPVPPEVQASIQIAQMENQRRIARDQAEIQIEQQRLAGGQQQQSAQLQLRQQEAMARQQLDAMQLQMKAAAESFDQQLRAARQQFEEQLGMMRLEVDRAAKAMAQQVELEKNREDNDTRFQTEILKNTDDNDTQLMIARQDHDRQLIEGVVQSFMNNANGGENGNDVEKD